MPVTPRAPRAARVLAVAGAMAVVCTALAALGLGSACSSSAKLVAAGGSCELASDCEEGLVCIPDPGTGTGRTCSSDLTSVQMTEFPDAGPDAAMATADGGDAGTATYPTDSATPPVTDSSPTPPTDAATKD